MSLIIAITITVSLYLSLQGIIGGTYFLLVLLGLNVLMVSYSATFLMGFYKVMLKTPDDFESALRKRDSVDNGILFLVRSMLLGSVDHIYTLGYVFFAGVALVTVIISLFSTILAAFERRYLS